jgi:hypothetical protein
LRTRHVDNEVNVPHPFPVNNDTPDIKLAKHNFQETRNKKVMAEPNKSQRLAIKSMAAIHTNIAAQADSSVTGRLHENLDYESTRMRHLILENFLFIETGAKLLFLVPGDFQLFHQYWRPR